MVADVAADFGLTRRHAQAAHGHQYLGVVMPQIAGLRSGPDIDPLAQVAMAQEALVILVREAMNDARFDLPANPAERADRRAAPHLRSQHLRARADVAGPFQPGERAQDGVA